jgi:hypothetical protein
LQSCATHHPQFGNKIENPVADNATDTSKLPILSFLIGDAGNADKENAKKRVKLSS